MDHHTRSPSTLLPDDLNRIRFVVRPAPAYWKTEWYFAMASWPPETEACAGAQSSCPYDALWRSARYVLARLGLGSDGPPPGRSGHNLRLFAPNP